MLDHGFFSHHSADGTAFNERIRRYYTDRGFTNWSVGEALMASHGARRRRIGDRRSVARVAAASRDRAVAGMA